MNDIQVQTIDGELYADSRHVAEALGVEHRALLQLIRSSGEDFQRVAFQMEPLQTAGGVQNTVFAQIPERECLLLITYVKNTDESKGAKRALIDAFQAMRKKLTQAPTGANLLALAVLEAHRQLEEKDQQIALMKPKAEFFDAVAGSKSAVHLGDVAKNLDVPGIGRNNLFDFLRKSGVLMSDNMPYQEHVDARRFRVIQQTHTHPKTLQPVITYTTLALPRGVKFILDLLKKAGHAPRKVEV